MCQIIRQKFLLASHLHSCEYSYLYSYGLITLAIACVITGHTRTSKSTDYCPNCTQKCVINYTNNLLDEFMITSGTQLFNFSSQFDPPFSFSPSLSLSLFSVPLLCPSSPSPTIQNNINPKHILYFSLFCMQASLRLTAAMSGSSLSHPSLIVKEMHGENVKVFLVCEQVIISEIAGMEAPLVLLAAYYSVCNIPKV